MATMASSIEALNRRLDSLQSPTTAGSNGGRSKMMDPNYTIFGGQKGRGDPPRDNGKNNLPDRGSSHYPPSADEREVTRENFDSAIQLSKPKDADHISLTSHPKVGDAFLQWQDATRERVCRASAFPNKAFSWILRVEDPDCTFEELRNPGALAGLDCKLADAL